MREICSLVGGLPLAVRLAGRYLAQTEVEAGEYLAWLRETPLEALHSGDRQHESVSVLLERSLQRVSEEARSSLGAISLLTLDSFAAQAPAAALDAPQGEVGRWLGELVDYGLLSRDGQRYAVTHALIHTYAGEHHRPDDQVVRRLAGSYHALARAETRQGVVGYARLDEERPHVMRVLAVYVEREVWGLAQSLASVIDGYLGLQGHWTEWIQALDNGLAAARGAGDRQQEGVFLGKLGRAYSGLRLGQVHEAIGYYERALAISQEVGDRHAEGAHLGDLGRAYNDLGKLDDAIDYYERALAISQEVGDRHGEGLISAAWGVPTASWGRWMRRSTTTSVRWPSPRRSATGEWRPWRAGTWGCCTKRRTPPGPWR